ncbi:unnamed protein product [Spirodela intermedia]|uniref:Uncharacterized protein n=1 Tax=Spirodela intermedia TaxID=51605 RepID=A0A7I8I9K8_SPIIN|nr:unnamed protein product [Spirodela intermedia]CAA6654345.1 unnamed protein product [Spirodela intermedia]
MASKTPFFPIQQREQQQHHYSDFGFDPEIEYLQVLEEARKPCRPVKSSPDSLRFVLRKPISDDESNCRSKAKKRRKWWRNPLLFLKWRRADCSGGGVLAAPSTGGVPRPLPTAVQGTLFPGRCT